MHVTIHPREDWREIAVFELESGRVDALDAFVARFEREVDHDGRCRVQSARHSPDGYRWLEAHVDFRYGERRALRLASAFIGELDQASLPGYRLIAGREWMHLAAAAPLP